MDSENKISLFADKTLNLQIHNNLEQFNDLGVTYDVKLPATSLSRNVIRTGTLKTAGHAEYHITK